MIHVFEVTGAAPDAGKSKERRRRKRWARGSDSEMEEQEEEPDEEGVEETGPCEMQKVDGAEVWLSTQVNHCELKDGGAAAPHP